MFIRLAALFALCSARLISQDVYSPHYQGEGLSHDYHILHYKIDVSIDEKAKTVDGNVLLKIVPLRPDLRTVRLNAGQMTIYSAKLGKKDLKYDYDSTLLSVRLDTAYSFGDTVNLSIKYFCKPKQGMNFSGPDSGYPAKRWQVWSQGEDTTNHFWFPCYDFPNEKSTSEVFATVNSRFKALSNGKLVGVTENKNGTKTFHWFEGKPHASYLIMVAAGDYAILHDKAGKLPLDFYVYPDDTANARICFKQTAAMIKFFNEKIGFAYPWEKYAQIILQDHFGGMENTSATTLTDLGSVYDARVRVDDSPTSLFAHELAHQWWGDVVTCRDFRHMWLNESFASYFDPLYHEFSLGEDEFDYRMYSNQQAGIFVDTARSRRPVVSFESFGDNLYPRGSAILNMLHFVVGDDLFWKGINHYITKYQFTSVETNDLKRSIEEATGLNLYWFFDEWLYKAGHPVFDVTYRWSDSAKSVMLGVKQVQTLDSLTGVFSTPVDIEVTTSAGPSTRRVTIASKDTVFEIPCSEKPLLVIFDKGNKILKELRFTKSNEEWRYQATMAPNPIDRMRALQALAASPDHEASIEIFTDRIRFDRFWAVRREAINLAGKMDVKIDSFRDRLKGALMAALKDPKSAVRDAAASQLGAFRGQNVAEALRASLQDSSYNVMASALRSLSKADSANSLGVIKAHLDYPSFRNRVSNAALGAYASLDSVGGLSLAMQKTSYGEDPITRFTAMRLVGRYGKGNQEVTTLLIGLLGDKSGGIRSTAARMLGDMGDQSALGPLQKIADDKENSASDAAKRSIERLKKGPAKKLN